ncbi:hypothetical protein Tco_1426951 [Tanacetum coccineum]
MARLNFANSHNTVAYLEKSTENADFAEIVDFLNANPIRYALTVSPTIYVSCIEQFWSTAKTKTVNNETQIHAKVEGKTIVISESSSSGPITLVADETVNKKREDIMERAATTASSLETEYDNGNINRTQSMATLNEPSPQGTGLAKEIANLKKRVKKLERKRKSRTPRMNLFKIGTSRKRSLGEEDASKHRRNLKQRAIFEDSDFDEEFDANMDEAFEQVYEANKDVEGDAE